MRLLLLVLAVALPACGGDDGAAFDAGGGDTDPGDADPGDADGVDAAPHGRGIELGTGTTLFQDIPLEGEPELPLIRGPQGGWHVWASVRLYDLQLDRLLLGFTLTDPADGSVLSYPADIVLSERRVMPEGDHFVRLGDRVIFMIKDPDDVIGRVLDLTATATPSGGETFRDERRFTVGEEVVGF